MTIRICSAAIILALSYSLCGAPATASLAILVRAYRESPGPARRAAIVSYIAGHPKDAALVNLALGIAAYEQKNYPAAIAGLKPLAAKLAPIADYVAYYLAAARVESNDFEVTAADLAPARRNSPLNGKSWLLEARVRKASAAPDAVRLLREHYAELPQPEGDVTLADCYQAANDLPQAVGFYQQVYYHYLSGAAAARSAAALLTLKDAMGGDYPAPRPAQLLHRADRLMDAREYAQAREEYQAAAQSSGPESDQARVRIGAADYFAGKTALAWPYLRDLAVADSDAAAERLYYLAECARQRNDDEQMMSAVQQLAAHHQPSPWRLKALMSAANRYLLVNRPQDYLPLLRTVYQDFPNTPAAAQSHWKTAFQAYLHDRADAPGLLREHLRQYPAHATAGAALYFLGRHMERSGDVAGARACYRKLAAAFENHYYAMLARERLKAAAPAASPSQEIAQFLAAIQLSAAAPVTTGAAPATQTRIERSRLHRRATRAARQGTGGLRRRAAPGHADHEEQQSGLPEPAGAGRSAPVLGTPVPAALPRRSGAHRPGARSGSVPAGGIDPPGIGVQPAGGFAGQSLRAYANSSGYRTAVCTQGGSLESDCARAISAGGESEDRQFDSALHAKRPGRQRGADAGRL